MTKCPKIGARVSHPRRQGCGAYTGTVIAHYQSFVYDAEDRPTNRLEPESQWSVGVMVDAIPQPWPYPDRNTIAPQVSSLKPSPRISAEKFVRFHYPDATALHRPAFGRTIYAVFVSDNCSRRHGSNIIGDGFTESKAWINAQANILTGKYPEVKA